MSTETNIEAILQNIEGEMKLREGIIDTPKRVAKMYKEIFDGYGKNPQEVLSKTFSKELDYEDDYEANNGLVIVKDIDFFSHCEHHLVPFFGKVHIGYIPNERVVGLSKLVRLTNIYAHRLQVQERLGEQIANAIMEYLDCEGCIVVIEAVHLCMVMRGVKNPSAKTITSAIRGDFLDNSLRQEFFNLVRG